MIGVGEALLEGGRRALAGKDERRGDATERAAAPRATNGVVVGSDGGTRLEFGFEDVVAISSVMSHHHVSSESLQEVCSLNLMAARRLILYIKLLFSVQIASFKNLGDLIHIHGHPGSGKTHLLYFLLATCTLPTHLNGWDKAAIVFDMDHKFNISRFKELLIGRLKPSLPSETITTIVERCLKHMHIFRPTSSDQLAVTLSYLPKYHVKHFPDMALGMVAIHSVDAFYWLDHFKAEQLRLAHNSLQNIPSILEAIRLSLGSVVVLTDWGLVQHRQIQYAYNSHPNPTLIHQITLSVINTDDPEDRHTLGIVDVHGRPVTGNFTLKIQPKALSVDLELQKQV